MKSFNTVTLKVIFAMFFFFWLLSYLGIGVKSLKYLQYIFEMTIQPDPLIAIFGVKEQNNRNLSVTKLKITEFVSLLAQRLILLN